MGVTPGTALRVRVGAGRTLWVRVRPGTVRKEGRGTLRVGVRAGMVRKGGGPTDEPMDQFCSSYNQKKPLIDFGRFLTSVTY